MLGEWGSCVESTTVLEATGQRFVGLVLRFPFAVIKTQGLMQQRKKTVEKRKR